MTPSREKPPRPTVAEEVEALRRLTVPELAARYEDLFGSPPRVRRHDVLWKRCAWKIQTNRLGGMSNVAKAGLEELIGEIEFPAAPPARRVRGAPRRKPVAIPPRGPSAGTVFEREYRGQAIRAVVVPGGVEWNGTVYRSLSAVAQAVTGAHWNGKLFFGLTARSGRKP